MKRQDWKVYIIFILLTEAVGIISGLLSRNGIQEYEEIMGSVLTPPAILFPIVWTILYLLQGIGATRIRLSSSSHSRIPGLLVFIFQLMVNFLWSPIFFNLQAFGWALLWLMLLWVLIVLMILLYRKNDRIAAWLQFPYLIWVSFAGYLNYIAWVLN